MKSFRRQVATEQIPSDHIRIDELESKYRGALEFTGLKPTIPKNRVIDAGFKVQDQRQHSRVELAERNRNMPSNAQAEFALSPATLILSNTLDALGHYLVSKVEIGDPSDPTAASSLLVHEIANEIGGIDPDEHAVIVRPSEALPIE